jgi:hypothetical protein
VMGRKPSLCSARSENPEKWTSVKLPYADFRGTYSISSYKYCSFRR